MNSLSMHFSLYSLEHDFGINGLRQPINMKMIYYWDKRNGYHLEHVR